MRQASRAYCCASARSPCASSARASAKRPFALTGVDCAKNERTSVSLPPFPIERGFCLAAELHARGPAGIGGKEIGVAVEIEIVIARRATPPIRPACARRNRTPSWTARSPRRCGPCAPARAPASRRQGRRPRSFRSKTPRAAGKGRVPRPRRVCRRVQRQARNLAGRCRLTGGRRARAPAGARARQRNGYRRGFGGRLGRRFGRGLLGAGLGFRRFGLGGILAGILGCGRGRLGGLGLGGVLCRGRRSGGFRLGLGGGSCLRQSVRGGQRSDRQSQQYPNGRACLWKSKPAPRKHAPRGESRPGTAIWLDYADEPVNGPAPRPMPPESGGNWGRRELH